MLKSSSSTIMPPVDEAINKYISNLRGRDELPIAFQFDLLPKAVAYILKKRVAFLPQDRGLIENTANRSSNIDIYNIGYVSQQLEKAKTGIYTM